MISKLFPCQLGVQTNYSKLDRVTSSPIKIASIDILRIKRGRVDLPLIHPRADNDYYLIRSRSVDGAVGFSVAHQRIKHFYPILQQLIIPYFVGKDAKDLVSLIDEIYTFRSNYKLSGLALWCCVAWVEISLLDLIGRLVNKSISELLGGVNQKEIPIYLSSLRRDTTPEEEIEWVGKRLEETGACTVKFKIGGRMSCNADAMPQRTENLVAHARKVLGKKIIIGVDGNGSFTASKAIKLGKFLESYGVSFFEEPCPFDDFNSTARVTKSLSLAVTGGEQETSFSRFEHMISHQVVNVLQPDLVYNGGFIRTLRVAQVAAQAGIPVTIHNARLGFDSLYMAQFASFLPGVFQEYNARPEKPPKWFSPALAIKGGKLQIPEGPGLGIEIDPDFLRKAHKLRNHPI
ncbi:MAG: mandelate racemase/muconate lactonizing enzyme family protein [Cyanobacteria bacterium P01_H01_bin.21]